MNDKSIWVVATVSKDPSRMHRAQSFWESKKLAINNGIFGWNSPGEVLSEAGYYDYIVVEELQLNHPLPCKPYGQVWFKIVEGTFEVKRCKTPARFKNVVGFW